MSVTAVSQLSSVTATAPNANLLYRLWQHILDFLRKIFGLAKLEASTRIGCQPERCPGELIDRNLQQVLARQSVEVRLCDILGGITNGGNTCYLAAALQGINSCTLYRSLFYPAAGPLAQRDGESAQAFEIRQKLQSHVHVLLANIKQGITISAEQINALRESLIAAGCNKIVKNHGMGSGPEALHELLELVDLDLSIVCSAKFLVQEGAVEFEELERRSLVVDPLESQSTDMAALLCSAAAGGQFIEPELGVIEITVRQPAHHKVNITRAAEIRPFGEQSAVYDLVGIIEHSPGHYTAKVRAGAQILRANDGCVRASKTFTCKGELYIYQRRAPQAASTEVGDARESSTTAKPSEKRSSKSKKPDKTRSKKRQTARHKARRRHK